jgi:hypothetical protein
MGELEKTQDALRLACRDIIKSRASEFGTTYDPEQTKRLYDIYMREGEKADG